VKKLKVLDLFSGVGGFSLGLERTGGFETVAFCEIDPYAQKVLKKHWPDVPIIDDIRNFDGIAADVICGGYPCQPFSNAGKRDGAADDRHLWPEMYRLIKSVKPRWVIAENVAGHITMGLDNVLSDLEAEGYAWWTFIIPAVAVDAKHRRDRVWILAHSESERSKKRTTGASTAQIDVADTRHTGIHQRWQLENAETENGEPGRVEPNELPEGRESTGTTMADTKSQRTGYERENIRPTFHEVNTPDDASGDCRGNDKHEHRQDVAHSIGAGLEGQPWHGANGNKPGRLCEEQDRPVSESGLCGNRQTRWEPEPAICRVAHGIPSRVDRLKCLGNAVVPQIPEMIGYAILEAEKA